MDPGSDADGASDPTYNSPTSGSNDLRASPSPERKEVESDQASPASPRLPTLRNGTGRQSSGNMSATSSPLGNVNAARRPTLPQSPIGSARGSQLPQDMQAKMKAFHLSRQGAPQNAAARAPSGTAAPSMANAIPGGALGSGLPSSSVPNAGVPLLGTPGAFRMTPGGRAPPPSFASAPPPPSLTMNPKMGLAAKRGLGKGMKLSDATGSPTTSQGTPSNADGAETKSQNAGAPQSTAGGGGSLFTKYSEFVDTKTGTLRFKGKATVHGKGIDFSSGSSFSISLDEVDTLDELGKGNYGTVYKVRHSRPRIRKPGQGLAGNRAMTLTASANGSLDDSPSDAASISAPVGGGGAGAGTGSGAGTGATTGVVMAMKEIRLELDDAKFAAIIMELDILHRCISPFIVDFYGAFFQEGAVYICMEFMDGGSIDKLYGDGVPEPVLRKIAHATVVGLKFLKDEHNIIHRDVKPTNILVNSRGLIKICDFGVSGNLVASIAKTNIGCQSYMAPERISGGSGLGVSSGVAQAGANPGGGTYSVQSDIWSLGLTIIECALGQYPYPPETYDNIFSQLSAIVDGAPPDLPADTFSESARDFVRATLHKVPKLRPTYAMLLRHPWLAALSKPETIAEEPEDEENEEAAAANEGAASGEGPQERMIDEEVGQWVRDAIAQRKARKAKKDAEGGEGGDGTSEGGGEGERKKSRPALHAAPLDAAAAVAAVGVGTESAS